MTESIQLTQAERIELNYLKLKGFRYLVRNEIGSVNVFVNKPHRDKETNYAPYGKTRGGYDHWIETKTPISIEEQRRRRTVELGQYSFIKWENEPMCIDDLLKAADPDPSDIVKELTKVIARNLVAWDTSKDKRDGLLPEVYLSNQMWYEALTGEKYFKDRAIKKFNI